MIQRLRRELRTARRAWLSPELDDLAMFVAGRLVKEPSEADVLVVSVDRVSAHGEIPSPLPSRASKSAEHRIIALLEPRHDSQNQTILIDSVPPPEPRAIAALVVCELGVLEVRPEGLVIVELAPNVSATDLQGRAQPCLLISPRVQQM